MKYVKHVVHNFFSQYILLMASFAQQEQQEQQQVIEIHNMFIQINKEIQNINVSTNEILSSDDLKPDEKISELGKIIKIIHTTKELVNSIEKIIADALIQHSISVVNVIREDAQDKIDIIHSSREAPALLVREDMTIGSTNGTGMNTADDVNTRINLDMKIQIDEIIKKMQDELNLYGQEQLKHFKNADVLIEQIRGYLVFMENIVNKHIELLNNPPNSGGKKKRKTKKIKKKAKTKKSKKSKMKKIKRKTMKKKKSKKHKR